MGCCDFGQVGSIAGRCAEDQVAAFIDQLFRSCLGGRLVGVVNGFENDQVLFRNTQFLHCSDDALVSRLAPAAVIYDIGLDLTDLEGGEVSAFRGHLVPLVLADQVDGSCSFCRRRSRSFCPGLSRSFICCSFLCRGCVLCGSFCLRILFCRFFCLCSLLCSSSCALTAGSQDCCRQYSRKTDGNQFLFHVFSFLKKELLSKNPESRRICSLSGFLLNQDPLFSAVFAACRSAPAPGHPGAFWQRRKR